MKLIAIGAVVAVVALIAALGLVAETNAEIIQRGSDSSQAAIDRGARWLVSVQGADGGWGQDGSGTSYNQGFESNGNDVANTAVAALALLEAGREYRDNVEHAVGFVLAHIEASPIRGIAVTDVQGTQIQRKLGPYIDTFLAASLLAEVDGTFDSPRFNRRVRQALEKVVAKIEQNQSNDGSWNIEGGWAPILGTSLASRSLFEAAQKGVRVDSLVLDRANEYTRDAIGPISADGSFVTAPASAEAAGIPLYQSAQALEQLSRTEEDRIQNADEIAAISGQLSSSNFVEGFGSVGGEEFFSYLNLSDGLKRDGGEAWDRWRTDISGRILSLQNNDGSWAGHHCITGRVAVTSGAILNLGVTHAG